MEEHCKAVKQLDAKADTKIVVLDIDGNYSEGNQELTRILRERLSKYLGKI
jgi:predicted protein tyrosine phosphatase